MSIPDYSNYPDFEPDGMPQGRARKFPFFNVLPKRTNILTPRQPIIVVVGRHWDDTERRSILCAGDDGSCPFDHERQSYRWTGYLLVDVTPVRDLKGKEYRGTAILHITPGAVLSCPQLKDKSLNLMRYQIQAIREGETERSPVSMSLINHDVYKPRPVEFDVRGYVRSTFQAPNNAARRSKKGGHDR